MHALYTTKNIELVSSSILCVQNNTGGYGLKAGCSTHVSYFLQNVMCRGVNCRHECEEGDLPKGKIPLVRNANDKCDNKSKT